MAKKSNESLADMTDRLRKLGDSFTAMKAELTKARAENHVLKSWISDQGYDLDKVLQKRAAR